VGGAVGNDALVEFCSSEYARAVAGITSGLPPAIDLAAESRLIEALVSLAGENLLSSAHDLSDGGLAVALAESAFASKGLSVNVELRGDLPGELALFAENGARAVLSIPQASLAQLERVTAQWGVAAQVIGKVTRGPFQLTYNGTLAISDNPASLQSIWAGAIERAVLGSAAEKQ
jgi:phosphoribosylformylglycinamidine synthase